MEFVPSLVSLGYLVVHEAWKDFEHVRWERHEVMAPAPHGHAADAEEPGGRAVAAKHDFEQEKVPPCGLAALEAR